MVLFWLVSRNNDALEPLIREGRDLLFARMHVALSGYEGEFVEGHRLDDKTTRKLPNNVVGETLNQKQAAALFDKLG